MLWDEIQKEREAYEVIVEDGKLVYQQSGDLVDTDGDCKWIFVLSTSRNLYVGQKRKGSFQHSSFLAGAATTAAGRLVAHKGVLEVLVNFETQFSFTYIIMNYVPLPKLMFLVSGYMAVQRSLSSNRRELQGVPELPPG